MVVVCCSSCGAGLTGELSSEPLARLRDHDQPVPVGAWAVDPSARTVSRWERGMPRGEYRVIQTDPPGCVVVHPADRLNGALVDVAGRSAGCCGLDGCDGPNQACAACGAVVATARTDCWTTKEVRFLPLGTNMSSPRRRPFDPPRAG